MDIQSVLLCPSIQAISVFFLKKNWPVIISQHGIERRKLLFPARE